MIFRLHVTSYSNLALDSVVQSKGLHYRIRCKGIGEMTRLVKGHTGGALRHIFFELAELNIVRQLAFF